MNELTNGVADMAAELNELRTSCDSLRLTVALQAQELDKLRVDNVMLRAAAQRSQDRSVAMYTIMEQVSAGLISGLTRMNNADKATKRQQQADLLGVGDADASPVYRPEEPKPSQPAKPKRTTPRSYYVDGIGGVPATDADDVEGDVIRDSANGKSYRFNYGQWLEFAPDLNPLAISSVVRTDIPDNRLPVVTPGDNADVDSLRKMHAVIGERQTK